MTKICYGEMFSLAKSLGCEVIEGNLPGDCTGLYLRDYSLIVIDCKLPEYAKRCTLCHELIHAEHADCGCGSRAGVIAEARTRRETALHLIDLVDYQACEKVYGADSFRIAAELDVTKQVVDDFKNWLADQPSLWRAVVD